MGYIAAYLLGAFVPFTTIVGFFSTAFNAIFGIFSGGSGTA